jgi:hypothetical protein
MSHRFHPDFDKNDPQDAIFYDNCIDCESKAQDLGIRLDPETWARMWRRMLCTETIFWRAGFGSMAEKPGYRTDTEKDLGRQMYHLFVILERIHGSASKVIYDMGLPR